MTPFHYVCWKDWSTANLADPETARTYLLARFVSNVMNITLGYPCLAPQEYEDAHMPVGAAPIAAVYSVDTSVYGIVFRDGQVSLFGSNLMGGLGLGYRDSASANRTMPCPASCCEIEGRTAERNEKSLGVAAVRSHKACLRGRTAELQQY
jgi:hypothetical protein